MATDSKAGYYSHSAGPSRQATDRQLGVSFEDTGPGILLSEMTSQAVGQARPNAPVTAAEGREEESTNASAAVADDDIPANRRPDTEPGGDQRFSPIQLFHLRGSSQKTALLLIMFTLQAALYIFFAVTLAGVGDDFLSGIPAIISLMGSAIAVFTVITNFGIQVKEGRGSENP